MPVKKTTTKKQTAKKPVTKKPAVKRRSSSNQVKGNTGLDLNIDLNHQDFPAHPERIWPD